MSDNFYGIYRAQVVSVADPQGKRRVRLLVPQILGAAASGWAEPLTTGAIPAINSLVWASFIGGDPDRPLYTPNETSSAGPASEVTTTELASNSASTSPIVYLTTPSLLLDGMTAVKITINWYGIIGTVSGDIAKSSIFDSSQSVQSIGACLHRVALITTAHNGGSYEAYTTPPAGTHAYQWVLQRVSGTGSISIASGQGLQNSISVSQF